MKADSDAQMCGRSVYRDREFPVSVPLPPDCGMLQPRRAKAAGLVKILAGREFPIAKNLISAH